MRLVGASEKWFNLGLALGLDRTTLNATKNKFGNDVQICLGEMLTKRLQSGGPLSWKVLCDCLRSPKVKRSDVATEIEEEMGKQFAWYDVFEVKECMFQTVQCTKKELSYIIVTYSLFVYFILLITMRVVI